MITVCILGLGYIGLPTSILAAKNGFDVYGFDIDKQRIERIIAGDPVIEEPDVNNALQEALASGKFHPTTTIMNADFFIIAVPTPFLDNKDADLSFVWKAAESISNVLKRGNTVIIESTIPVGTTHDVAQLLEEQTGYKVGQDFYVAHCPERVLPGNIFHELVNNARIIGGINHASVDHAKEFYKPFVKGALYLTNSETAEMVKLVENSSRDIAIAFANQVASMAYKVGLDPFEVIELANKHPRVNILKPSCGVGGHCIAVDPWFLIRSFPNQSQLLLSARTVNDEKPQHVIETIAQTVEGIKKQNNKKISVLLLGLTYKPDIDDIRESPALAIAKKINQHPDIDLLICDPHVHEDTIFNLLGKRKISLQAGIDAADVIVCLVPHREFKTIDKAIINSKQVLDFCGLFYTPHHEDQMVQEQLFWPASNAAINTIIKYSQGEYQ